MARPVSVNPGRPVSGAIASVTPSPAWRSAFRRRTLSSVRMSARGEVENPRPARASRPARLRRHGSAPRATGLASQPLDQGGRADRHNLTSISGSNFSPADRAVAIATSTREALCRILMAASIRSVRGGLRRLKSAAPDQHREVKNGSADPEPVRRGCRSMSWPASCRSPAPRLSPGARSPSASAALNARRDESFTPNSFPSADLMADRRWAERQTQRRGGNSTAWRRAERQQRGQGGSCAAARGRGIMIFISGDQIPLNRLR
jgi:hypothetical protein